MRAQEETVQKESDYVGEQSEFENFSEYIIGIQIISVAVLPPSTEMVWESELGAFMINAT